MKVVVWKENPFQEIFFNSKEAAKHFLHVSYETLDAMLSSDRTKDGWQADEVVTDQKPGYVRKTNRPYIRKAKTLAESVKTVDLFLKGAI